MSERLWHAAMSAIVLAVAGCGVPERFALPVPLPLTQGGTAVPAQGAGGLIEFGDGLLGQELMRTEMLSVGLMGGVADRFSASIHTFTETRGNEMDGAFLRVKGRIGPLLGPATSVGVALASSWTAREAGDVQDERVTTLDVAVPAEILVGQSLERRREASVYLAPRVVHERYSDRLDPGENLRTTHWGALAGLHGRIHNLHLFGELNLLHLATRTVRGADLEGGFLVIPAIGIGFHFGRVHQWGRAAF